MTYRVIITARAKDDLRQAHGRAAQHAPQTAAHWLLRFETALAALTSQPQRCALAPESELVSSEIRQFLFGRGRNVYRALFTIQDNEVRILHIRWGGRDFAQPDELIE